MPIKSHQTLTKWNSLTFGEKAGALGICFLLAVGIFGIGGTYENTSDTNDRGFLSRLNPFAAEPTEESVRTLNKEYIYAGTRLLAVEDANAVASPPADLAIWRPSTGTWWVHGSPGSQQTSHGWGTNGDLPVQGDYDGDGKTDFCVFRPSANQWWIFKSSDNTYYPVTFGTAGDIPAHSDYDGDGRTDIAVFRPSSAVWYVLRSGDGGITTRQFGLSSDIPGSHDFDGDGRADIAVWRNSSSAYYSLNSSDSLVRTASFSTQVPSNSGAKPVPGDYDGDGHADYAVKNGSKWVIAHSSSGQTTAESWQLPGDLAVQNDYDGDGKVDIAVWRNSNGTWYIRNSSDLLPRTTQWGMSGDIPVPAFYRR